MKFFKILLLIIFLFFYDIFSQNNLFKDNNPDQVVKIHDKVQRFEFESGEILIKFKNQVNIKLGKSNGFYITGIPSIDQIFQKYKVNYVVKLFPQERPLQKKEILRDFNGHEFERPSIHNIYHIKLDTYSDMFSAIEELKENENIEYAEPNYIYSIVEDEALSPPLSEKEMMEWVKDHGLNNNFPRKINSITPNDPLYSQQYWIQATQVDAMWDSTTGDTTEIIGILDTGVDYLHPDLSNKIWINTDEIPDNGIDDDGNGYVDDIIGWDWINNDNDPKDDNSHGTHVAGIAAAEANNGIGIAGVNWNAKIMILKVFQSSGRGNIATIIQGIYYAINKGVKALNMSWGSYARSYTLEDVLKYAYPFVVLVGAAGNDGKCIGPGMICAPFFPAALSYVFGVEASSSGGGLTFFSNFDQDGPVFSLYEELFNYELRVPGQSLISCIPNGNYRVYSGTSMAAPIVSAGTLLYKRLISEESIEMMWIKFINTRGSNWSDVKFFDALTLHPKPLIYQLSRTMVDSCETCDKDGRVDAGETIEVWFKVRNVGGPCDSVFYKLRFKEFEDTTTAQILKFTAYVGSMGPYATRNSTDPFIIKIKSDVAHDRDIVFETLMWYKGSEDTLIQSLIINVENGTTLSGVLDTIMILTPDRLWLVNESFRIGLNGSLIIKPGTKIIFYPWKGITVRGDIQAIGTKDSMIVFLPKVEFQGGGIGYHYSGFSNRSSNFEYCYFENLIEPFRGPTFNARNCIFSNIHLIYYTNYFENNICIFLGSSSSQRFHSGSFIKNNFIEIRSDWGNVPVVHSLSGLLKFNNFINCSVGQIYSSNDDPNTWFNSFIRPNGIIFMASDLIQDDYLYIRNQYLGTTDSIKIDKLKIDFFDSPGLPYIVFSPLLISPPDSCHGIVWKVLVNGRDAQDEVVDPVGIGPVRFDVYFNRPMDTNYTPILGFGVREPYNSNIVRDSARWSPDRRIWTAYHTVKLYTGDGINRISVRGARDDEGFEIPVEDKRFEFLINAAGSASSEFQATPGLGRVNLEWTTPPALNDLLGYNLYRFEHLTDTAFTIPILVNKALILDTIYTDYSVIPNKKYYYYYKVVRTNFSETDSSRVVSAIPFTAAPGDANGDLSINVLDVMSIVAYILNQNPQPFIFEAADINQDSVINILDIVGVINKILTGGEYTKFVEKRTLGNGRIDLVKNSIEVSSSVPVGAIQLMIEGKDLDDLTFVKSDKLKEFELTTGKVNDTSYVILIYNLNGKTINEKEFSIGYLKNVNSKIKIIQGILSTSTGDEISTKIYNDGDPLIPEKYMLYQNYPNPFNANTVIQFDIPEKIKDCKIIIYNILGQRIKTFVFNDLNPGRYRVEWTGINDIGARVASGVYIYQIKSSNFTLARKMILLK